MTDCKGGTEIVAEPRDPSAEPPADLRRERAQTRPTTRPAADQQRLDVRPPQGVPVQPTQPTQRFFPTNQPPPRAAPTVRDPAGNN
jgi:hypothetical protein